MRGVCDEREKTTSRRRARQERHLQLLPTKSATAPQAALEHIRMKCLRSAAVRVSGEVGHSDT
jgi:hypothetical protein